MRARQFVCAAALLLTACGSKPVVDPNNREIPWSYGPRTSDATAEHLAGTGTKGATAVAVGWHCRLIDQRQLVVRPYQLAAKHALFDQVALSVGLFDRNGQPIGQFLSAPLQATTTALPFDLTPEQAAKLYDLVLYYVAK